uniref:ribosomal protein L14 n=1 Tax=Cryptomonas gyropyrenoidosa TaxID=233257 RepID=UPI0027A062F1|nr:ribosomal protein L14 [Cryptomonas gyropyrenoidosa]WFQ82682.1 ribosomal protein L14 [Cryptomonas gyropyrenoidosa]
MIFNSTILKVCDNSGVKTVKCFNVQRNCVNGLLYVSIKNSKIKSKFKNGNVIKALVVRKKKLLDRETGGFVSFHLNECIVLNQKYEFLGSRIFGPLPLETRKRRNLKILSLASSFI